MSPQNFHNDGDQQQARTSEINGSRPSPLKISKGSHVIHKAPSSSSINGMTIKQEHQKQPHQPVIIYSHSPKIIHTQPREFMALVQKLTGLSSCSSYKDNNETTPSSPKKVDRNDNISKPLVSMISYDDNESCSGLTDENHVACKGGYDEDIQVTSSSTIDQANQFLADIPLFTPNSANFFCSPQAMYRNSDSTNNMGNSPSLLEFMEGLPEY